MVKHPIRAERDPITGMVQVWDCRPKQKQLIDLLTPEAAEVLFLDMQRAHIDEQMVQLERKLEEKSLRTGPEARRRALEIAQAVISAIVPATPLAPLNRAEEGAEAAGRC